MVRSQPFILAPLSVLVLIASCTSPIRTADLGDLYREATQHRFPERNPVVLIPGLLGSRLADSEGRLVWGAFSGEFADPREDRGARTIALPMKIDVPLEELRHDHNAPGVLDRVRFRFLGLPIILQAYAQILGTLGVAGYRDEELGRGGVIEYGDDHYTCFQFPYDWRWDLVESARALDAFLEDRTRYVEEELARRGQAQSVRFDIVAHSMGGLVLRYYLRYGTADLPRDGSLPELTWAGARRVDRAILIGTPNSGSIEALQLLLEEYSPGPFLPRYSKEIVGTMPSMYQMLPRGRHGVVRTSTGERVVDLLDPEVWLRFGWGLASPEVDPELRRLFPDSTSAEDCRRIALDHLRKSLTRARRFQAALDRPARRPDGLLLALFAGDAIRTPQGAIVGEPNDPFRVDQWGPGDEVVLRSSAVMDERLGGPTEPTLRTPIDWSQVFFLFSQHLAMTRDAVFTDNLLYLLLESPRPRRSKTTEDPHSATVPARSN